MYNSWIPSKMIQESGINLEELDKKKDEIYWIHPFFDSINYFSIQSL